MAEIEDYKDLIKSIPIKKQSMLARKVVWQKRLGRALFKVVEPLFDKDEITITRGDILKETNSRTKIIKTLIWGYPTGGRGNHIKKALKKLDSLCNILSDYKKENLNKDKARELIRMLAEKDGIGPSTWSKLLYFFKVSVSSCKCQIFDKKIEQSLNTSQFKEFEKENGKWDQTKVDDFFDYIKRLSNVSKMLRVEPEQLENFLFYYNLNFKL